MTNGTDLLYYFSSLVLMFNLSKNYLNQKVLGVQLEGLLGTSTLNQRCKSFFQQPRRDPQDGIYNNNVPLGHNFLGSIMNKISAADKLSVSYTNHSLRTTTAHVLDVARFPSTYIYL